jgi:hypothetical protein
MSTITQTQLQQQYIAYFGRPGDPAGIKYWLASGITESEFAAKIHAQDEYQKSTVGDKSTEEQVNNLYKNLFGRDADPAGLLYWTVEVEAGRSSIAALALQMITSAKDDSPADAAALDAKTKSAIAFTADVEADTQAMLDYQAESTGATFKAGAAFESAVTWLAGITTTEATAAEVDTAITNMQAAGTTISVSAGTTTTLTTGVDVVSGTANNDTFSGSDSTLSSGDQLTGGEGTDSFNYSSAGTAAVSEAGFTSSSVEKYTLTSTTTGGTTINATGATGLTSIINSASTTDLTVNSLKGLASVELTSVSAGDTTVQFIDSLLTGTADELTLTLNTNATTANAAIGTVTVGNTSNTGFETVNISTTTGASQLTNIVTGATTLNITGDQNLTVTGALAGATTIAAGSFTGNLSVVADSAGTAKDVAITGGSGDDTANFTNGFEADDTFDGGAGTDTLTLTQATASTTLAGTLTSVEQVNISDSGTGTIDMDNFSGLTKVIYDAGITANGTATVDDAVSGIEVEVDVANLVAADASLVIDLKTDGASDSATVTLDTIGAGDGFASISVEDAETLTISADDDTTDATGTLTIAALTATDATSLTLSGDSAVTITNTVDPATPVLATLDASAMTDILTLSGTDFSASGSTVTFGSANDVFTVGTMSGADTIDLSQGGDDRIVYSALAQSDQETDTIKGFTSGSDDIDLTTFTGTDSTAGIDTANQFAGVHSTFALASGALTATKKVVFQADANTLWYDVDGDEDLDGNDFRVILEGVSTITAGDLNIATTGVTATSNQAAFNTASKGHFTEDNALTEAADTLNTTVAHLAGSTVNGLGGDDTIAVTGSGTFDFSGITFEGWETMTISTSVTGITLDDADLANNAAGELATVTGIANIAQSATVTAASNLTDTTFSEVETLVMGGATATIDAENLASFDTAITGSGVTDTLTLDATYSSPFDFSNTLLTAVETIAFGDATTLTFDAADLNNVTNFTATTATAQTVTLNDSDDISGITTANTIGTLTFGNFAVTVDANNITAFPTAITGSGGAATELIYSPDAALDLTNLAVTGVSIFDLGSADDKDITINVADWADVVTTQGGSDDNNLVILDTGNLQGTTVGAEYDMLTLSGDGTVTVDDTFMGTDLLSLNGDNAGAADTLAIIMQDQLLNLGAAAVGGTNADLNITITGTSGNDIITALDDKEAGSTFAITTGAGNDVIRLELNSGNESADAGTTDIIVLADAVSITDFDAGKDQIAIAAADLVHAGGTEVARAQAAGSIDANTSPVVMVTGATLNDFTSASGFLSAVGTINNLADGDTATLAISNVAGDQVGIYNLYEVDTTTGYTSTGDALALVAVVDVTSGTFSIDNLTVY